MESSYNRGNNLPTRFLMPPNKTYNARNRLHLIEVLVERVSYTHTHTHLETSHINKAIGYSV